MLDWVKIYLLYAHKKTYSFRSQSDFTDMNIKRNVAHN